jgi:hypothetical protein
LITPLNALNYQLFRIVLHTEQLPFSLNLILLRRLNRFKNLKYRHISLMFIANAPQVQFARTYRLTTN